MLLHLDGWDLALYLCTSLVLVSREVDALDVHASNQVRTATLIELDSTKFEEVVNEECKNSIHE